MKCSFTHIAFFLLAAALLAGGCHRTDPEEGTAEEIRFQVSEEWQDMGTKASTYTPGTIASGTFSVDAYVGSTTTQYIDGSTVSYSAGQWTFNDGKHYWPSSDNLDFFAWMPSDCAGTCVGSLSYSSSNGPSFTCTSLPVTSSGQSSLQEFVYAYATGKNKAADGASGVALEFHHPFAKISLQLKTSHRAIYNLNTIKFKNIKNNGTFTHANNPQWMASGDNTDLTITVDDGISADADFTSAQVTSMSLPLIVLPQSLTTADQIEVKLTWNNGDSETTYTFDNPVGEWQSGKSYTYTLDLLGEIKFSVIIDDWSSEETPRNIRF